MLLLKSNILAIKTSLLKLYIVHMLYVDRCILSHTHCYHRIVFNCHWENSVPRVVNVLTDYINTARSSRVKLRGLPIRLLEPASYVLITLLIIHLVYLTQLENYLDKLHTIKQNGPLKIYSELSYPLLLREHNYFY
jgi:hypothetical protein